MCTSRRSKLAAKTRKLYIICVLDQVLKNEEKDNFVCEIKILACHIEHAFRSQRFFGSKKDILSQNYIAPATENSVGDLIILVGIRHMRSNSDHTRLPHGPGFTTRRHKATSTLRFSDFFSTAPFNCVLGFERSERDLYWITRNNENLRTTVTYANI